MRKFNGVPKEHFALFLKECEWRFNNNDPKVQFDLRPNFPPLLSRVCQFVYDLMRPVFATSFLIHIR